MRTDLIQQETSLTTLNKLLLKKENPLPLSKDHLAFLIASTIYEGAKRFESKDYITSKVITLIQENSDVAKELDLSDDFQNTKKNIVEPNYQGLTLGHVYFDHPEQLVPDKVSTPDKNKKIDLPEKDILSKNYGKKNGQDLKLKFATLESEMASRLKEYQNILTNNTGRMSVQVINYYQDLISALSTNLRELRAEKNNGSRKDKVNLYNRLNYEFYLEVKFNINLTTNDAIWSMDDLKEVENQLDLLPEKFTTLDFRLREIRMESQKENIAAVNYNKGLISIGAGKIDDSLIHEVGHNWDKENPKWKEFLSLSGWRDVTKEFKDISSDYKNKTYKPEEGKAQFKKDGKIYQDGDKIDLNGDGKIDGFVKVQYDKVWVHSLNAKFIISYANSNPLEDFAETFEFFFSNPKWLKRVTPDKFEFMVDFLGYNPTQKSAQSLPKSL